MKLGQWLRRFGASVWSGWPERAYQRQRYQQRLSTVQAHLAECLEAAPAGPVRILSMCAGDGRDVIGVLESHRPSADVAAWLVELDSRSVAMGVRQATSAGLTGRVTFLNTDATAFATYKDIAPFDIVLVCGIWGHVQADEKAQLVRAVEALCKPGGAAIWTRGVSKGISRLYEVQAHFTGSLWKEVRVSFTPDKTWVVATHRYRGPAKELPASGQIFHFLKNAG